MNLKRSRWHWTVNKLGCGLAALLCALCSNADCRAAALDPEATYAFVVGVSDYTHDSPHITDLHYASDDAVRFIATLSEHLGIPSENITALHQHPGAAGLEPTRENIINELQAFMDGRQEEDTVIFFFSGHGLATAMEGYLAPQDCDPTSLEKSCLTLMELKNRLESRRVRARICLIDACHSAKGVSHANVDQVMQDVPDFYAMTSCTAGQQSFESPDWQQGLFTHWLCRGLEGAADRDNDAVISLDEVFNFLAPRVHQSARRQGQVQEPAKYEARATATPLAFALSDRPYEDAVETLAENLSVLIQHQYERPWPSVGTIEFAQDPLEPAGEPMLTTKYSVFANKLSRAVIDELRKHTGDAPLQEPGEVLSTLASKGPARLQPKDLDSPAVAGIEGMPRLLIKGTFSPHLNLTPGQVTVNCRIRDLQMGETVGQVSANIEIDPMLFAELQSVIASAETIKAVPAWRDPQSLRSYHERLWQDAQQQAGDPQVAGPLQIEIERHPQGNRTEAKRIVMADRTGLHTGEFGVAAGDTFSIHLQSIAAENLAVIVMVDGLNVLGVQDPAPGEQPLDRLVNDYEEEWEWLFPQGSRVAIDGWMTLKPEPAAKGMQAFNSAPFTVKNIAGAGGRSSYSDRAGEINIAVFGTKPANNGLRGDLAVAAGQDVTERVFQTNDSFVINHADLRGVYRIAYFDDAANSAPPAVPAARP